MAGSASDISLALRIQLQFNSQRINAHVMRHAIQHRLNIIGRSVIGIGEELGRGENNINTAWRIPAKTLFEPSEAGVYPSPLLFIHWARWLGQKEVPHSTLG